MWEYNNFDEIYHYGIPGMRWGHRKATPVTRNGLRVGTNNINKARAAMKARKDRYYTKEADVVSDGLYEKTYNSTYNKLIKSGVRKRKAARLAEDAGVKKAMGAEDVAYNKYKSDMKKLKSNYKQAKKQGRADRKQDIRDSYKKIKKSSSIGEKFLYNKATRKRAAKYMVDRNMSMADAKKAANKDARRNTLIALAAMGGIAAYDYYKKR